MVETIVQSCQEVGTRTVALALETPREFDALPGQFVLVRAMIDGTEETGYYTISSPTTDDSFEITVQVTSDSALGTWLADREVGDPIEIDGPFGDVQYADRNDVVVLAAGPGIGPAVGIGERARATDHDATLLYEGDDPAHADRLTTLEAEGATVVLGVSDLTDPLEEIDGDKQLFVFGFASFVDRATAAIKAAGLDPDAAEVENFGPE
ncbi:FAD-dependent oxidoreductase [Halorarius halobius]|uniref:FAD-dependent oxidoreductase n=1 Tax=Halorarius halobius TaxID=2962671 RepID=UPI0020CDB31D|nr:FAD-dependent oxidoreductase [Halorarius halobius]